MTICKKTYTLTNFKLNILNCFFRTSQYFSKCFPGLEIKVNLAFQNVLDFRVLVLLMSQQHLASLPCDSRLMNTIKILIQGAPNPKTTIFFVWSCRCLFPIYWSKVLGREWRCSWSSTDTAPTTSEWSTVLLPNKMRLILDILRYSLDCGF